MQVVRGDTLSKIARSLHADSRARLDQTMIALFRNNPTAFGGNINILRSGAVLRVPDADAIAALNQKEAMNEVHRQMSEWTSARGASAPSGGHLRLVTPTGNGTTGKPGNAAKPEASTAAAAKAPKNGAKDQEAQAAESKRLIEIHNAELAALQHKAGTPASAAPLPAPAPEAGAPSTATSPVVPNRPN